MTVSALCFGNVSHLYLVETLGFLSRSLYMKESWAQKSDRPGSEAGSATRVDNNYAFYLKAFICKQRNKCRPARCCEDEITPANTCRTRLGGHRGALNLTLHSPSLPWWLSLPGPKCHPRLKSMPYEANGEERFVYPLAQLNKLEAPAPLL